MAFQAQKNMQRSDFKDCLRTTVIAVALTLPTLAAQAQQVYKWVDANGRVQYSQHKPTDAATPHTEVKPPPPAQPVLAPPSVSPSALESRKKQPVATPAPRQTPSVPPSLSEGLNRETDAYRCALAKDILAGAVRHSNGARTDDHDRQVAQSDIRLFCK